MDVSCAFLPVLICPRTGPQLSLPEVQNRTAFPASEGSSCLQKRLMWPRERKEDFCLRVCSIFSCVLPRADCHVSHGSDQTAKTLPPKTSHADLEPRQTTAAADGSACRSCTILNLQILSAAGVPCLSSLFSLCRAFFWLVSLLLASLIWFISVHLSDQGNARLQYGLLVFGAAVSVLLQEAFRFAYFKLLK